RGSARVRAAKALELARVRAFERTIALARATECVVGSRRRLGPASRFRSHTMFSLHRIARQSVFQFAFALVAAGSWLAGCGDDEGDDDGGSNGGNGGTAGNAGSSTGGTTGGSAGSSPTGGRGGTTGGSAGSPMGGRGGTTGGSAGTAGMG